MRLTVNGRICRLDVAPDATLLSVLRDQLYLTGAKPSCERGECGACTVLVADPDGKPAPVYTCLALAHAYENDSVTTIEGLTTSSGPHPLQAAFVEHDALQCGYCTPGQICSATAMLGEAAAGWPSAVSASLIGETGPAALDAAEIRERMSGNLCRCGAYVNILAAITDVAREVP